jgi:hypothetical protein
MVVSDEQVSLFTLVLKFDFQTIFIEPEILRFDEPDAMFVLIYITFVLVEFKLHRLPPVQYSYSTIK